MKRRVPQDRLGMNIRILVQQVHHDRLLSLFGCAKERRFARESAEIYICSPDNEELHYLDVPKPRCARQERAAKDRGVDVSAVVEDLLDLLKNHLLIMIVCEFYDERDEVDACRSARGGGRVEVSRRRWTPWKKRWRNLKSRS